jgi:hypothetical protein
MRLLPSLKRLAMLSLTFDLAACDKIDQFIKKQDNLAQKTEGIEKQVAFLSARLDALEEKKTAADASYSSCVLDNMRGVTNDLAAQAVEEICLRKASSALDDLTRFKGSTAGYGQIYGYTEQRFGLYITVDNQTEFTLTEISIDIANKKSKGRKTYVAHYFPEPVGQGVIITGLPKDRTIAMRLLPGRNTFTLQINENVPEGAKFFDLYDWGIAGAKGFIQ